MAECEYTPKNSNIPLSKNEVLNTISSNTPNKINTSNTILLEGDTYSKMAKEAIIRQSAIEKFGNDNSLYTFEANNETYIQINNIQLVADISSNKLYNGIDIDKFSNDALENGSYIDGENIFDGKSAEFKRVVGLKMLDIINEHILKEPLENYEQAKIISDNTQDNIIQDNAVLLNKLIDFATGDLGISFQSIDDYIKDFKSQNTSFTRLLKVS